MSEDVRFALVDDVLAGLTGGAVAGSVRDLVVERRDDGSVLEVDLGDPDVVYVVTVTSVERVD